MKKRKKKYIAKVGGNYIVDKKVNRYKVSREISSISYVCAEGFNSCGAVKFYEDEKEWLDENDKEILEWEECDA